MEIIWYNGEKGVENEMLGNVFQTFSSLLALLLFILVPCAVLVKMVNKKKIPSNSYTPFDDMVSGVKAEKESFSIEMNGEDQKHRDKYGELLKKG